MTTSLDSLIETVRAIVAEVLDVPPTELSTETDLRAVEGADSIKVLRMIARIEREFEVELDDEDVFSVSTIGQVAGVVRTALQP